MKSDINREADILSEISHTLVREKNISSLLRAFLEILCPQLDLTAGIFYLVREGFLQPEAEKGTIPAVQNPIRIGEGLLGRVALTGMPSFIKDLSKAPEFREEYRGPAFRKMELLVLPLVCNEMIIGILAVTSRAPGLDKKQPLLEKIASIAAEAVDFSIEEYTEKEQLQAENLRLREELDSAPRPAEIIGKCSAMRNVYAQIAQVAPSSATVLIRGASGTGKELVAKAIVQAGPRAKKPFVAVNCAALPDNLIESELFGHEKGSFTGAVTRRIGRAEAADGGTLFLDEIGDLSLPVQVKLLRFIQERTFSRVGSNAEIKVDVRIITATSRDLEKLMEEGRFREDLYYRLNVFPIHLPALYKRRSDIMLLAEFFLEKFNRIHRKTIKRISTPAINMLMSYHWPGNVRELENCIERAVLTAMEDVINGYDLPPSLQTGEASGTAAIPDGGKADFTTLVNSFERELIVEALKTVGGNVAAAARNLNLSERILHYKINKMGITPEWYRKK